MKIKRTPEEFIVEEITDLVPGNTGRYFFYKLIKRGANTIDVLRDISRRLNIPFNSIKYGGMKDRHALSTQYITMDKQIDKLEGRNYTLQYAGKTDSMMGREHLIGNHFKIVVRAIDIPVEVVGKNIEEVKNFGFPNYYDDQRFGSARHGKGFVAKELILKRYKIALYLLLVESSPWDDKKTKKFRECLKESWKKDITPCAELAPTSWERKVVLFIGNKKISNRIARGAFARVDKEFLILICQTYQSYLWNETLKEFLNRLNVNTYPVPYTVGEHLFYNTLSDEQKNLLSVLEIPLISPGLKLEGAVREVTLSILKREGINGISDFNTRIPGALFKSVSRKAIVYPENLTYEISEDEIYKGSKKVCLEFTLKSGSYATVLIKRLFS